MPRAPTARPPAASGEVLDVGGAGVRGAHEDEQPGAGGAGGLEQRLERVDAEVRVGGERVGAEARDLAERRRRRADERLAVGGRRDGDVAALAVGEHEQAGGAGVLDDRLASAAQPGAPRRSKHASCGLTAHARGPGRVDQRAAVRDHRRGRALGGRPVGGHVSQRLRPQPRRVGVEPQDDLGLAPGDDLRQPVAEMRPERRPRCGAGGAAAACCGGTAVSR